MDDALRAVTQLLERPFAKRTLAAFLLVLVVLLGVRALRRLATSRIEDVQLRYRTRKTIGVAGWMLIAVAAAGIFSDKLGGLALSFGVMGAGIAFALQEVISSVAGRVAIMFNRFYDVGDRVQLGGIKGDVIDIGVLRTTVMEVGDWVKSDLFTGRIVRIANSFVFKEPVFNYSGEFSFLWDEITVPIRYECDHRLARATLQKAVQDVCGGYVADAESQWSKMLRIYQVEPARVTPMVTLVANDNWMEFTVRYVVPYTRRRTTRDELFTRILDDVNSSGGKLQLASATHEIVAFPRLEVRSAPSE